MMMFLNNLDIFDYLLNKKKRSGGGGEILKVTDAAYLFSHTSTYSDNPPDEIIYQCRNEILNRSDFSECTDYAYAFCNSNGPGGIIDCQKFTNIRNAYAMFLNCEAVEIINLDLRKVTSLSNTFNKCRKLKYIPELINFEEIESLESAFTTCSVASFPKDIRIPKCTSMYQTFYQTNIEEIDFHKTTTKVTNMYLTFGYNRTLKSIKGLSMKACTGCSDLVKECTNLEELEIFDISTFLTIGSGTSWGHKLTLDSLIHTIRELIYTYNTRTLTVGSANLEKLSGVYVKLTEELVLGSGSKVPFEVCESTDEGAMLITEYVLLKNWQLQ